MQTIHFGFILIALTVTIRLQAQTANAIQDKKKTNQIATKGKAADKKLMLPIMTEGQRNAYSKPIEGMIIYNKTAKKPQYYDGSAWIFFEITKHFIGEQFQGGIIFYLDAAGTHGLIAAPSDQNESSKWGSFENPVGASDKTIGSGLSNTNKIVKASTNVDIAARICSDLQLNGYSDWFLPSKEELQLMYQNLKLKGLGNLIGENYWSSSETDFNNAWLQNFRTGMPIEQNTSKNASVRAIRSF